MDAITALRTDLLQQLRNGTWTSGQRLPTERTLATQYGLGRASVRRVLGELKNQGLIHQTVGSGTYVTERAAALLGATTPPASVGISPSELMEARLALEPAIVELVVRNATAADFARMAHCCERAEQARTLADFEHWDGQLHEAIAQATHNAFIHQVLQLMNQARAQGEWGELKRKSVTPERRTAYQREHRALVTALRARDLPTAVARTREHLLHVRRNLLGL
jgi:DNA-binding FadR family transcriptional regulator